MIPLQAVHFKVIQMVHFILIYPVHLKVIWAVHLKCCNHMIDRFNESYILLSYPDGHALKGYYDDKTMTVADWAQMGGMFYSFSTHYTELPEETYSEVTFTMVIDTTDERTFTGSVKVSFK